MDKIRITSKDMAPHSLEFTRPDGTKIGNVTACDIKLRQNIANQAILRLNLDQIDIEAEPLLSLETVGEAAFLHGYCLTPLDPEDKVV